MSLLWPATPTDVVLDGPRLHAFVIGVGEYVHLGLNAARPATVLTGVAPLTTTVLAARRIAHWLEHSYQNPSCQLGSIEVLLSTAEMGAGDGGGPSAEAATMDNIESAFNAWYARCDSHPDNIAFFYFAGHGVTKLGHYLLAADFGNPDLPDEWTNCIDYSNMRIGMFKCKAKSQYFFVDACRDTPMAVLLQRNPHGRPLVTSSGAMQTELSAQYLAASEGRQAYGRNDEETYFCKALLTCLDGVGSRKAGPGWRVDAASLSMALPSVVHSMSLSEGLPLSCDCTVQKPEPFHYPASGGVVLAHVDCISAAARAEAAIRVTQGGEVFASPVGEQRPWVGHLRPGDTRFEMGFLTHPSETFDDYVVPPVFTWEVQR